MLLWTRPAPRRVELAGGGGEKVVLVLDQPDAWLAAAGAGDGVTSSSLRELVLDLREVSFVWLEGGF